MDNINFMKLNSSKSTRFEQILVINNLLRN